MEVATGMEDAVDIQRGTTGILRGINEEVNDWKLSVGKVFFNSFKYVRGWNYFKRRRLDGEETI